MLREAPNWEWHEGNGPVIGMALHAGHNVTKDLLPYLVIDEESRRREEDPYTDIWARCCASWCVVNHSRFEVDLNRPEAEAIYTSPEQSWGQHVWSPALPPKLFADIYKQHTQFYQELDAILDRYARRFGAFVILDMHSYNHRRDGPNANPADPCISPDLNIGTGSLDRRYWGPLVDKFICDMASFDYLSRPLDVRENVNFRGRYLAEHVHRKFPGMGCVLALEFKKTFMDEWTGAVNPTAIATIELALRFSIAGIENILASRYGGMRVKNAG